MRTPLLALALLAGCPATDEPATDSGAETDTDTDTDADSDTDTDADADSDTDADTDADSDTDADADSDTDTDTDTDTDPSCSTTPTSGTNIALQTVISSISAPTAITHAGDGSGRLFATSQAGTIVVRQPNGSTSTWLDITGRVRDGGERGLLGLAFHPDYESTGRVYVHYTDNNSDTVVSEFTVAQPLTGTPDPNSERVLLTEDQPANNHNGGALAFSPVDGYLYIGLGDGGGAGDTYDNGQRKDTFLAKILRIDVDGSNGGGGAYGIPADNPFVGDNTHRPETWAWGLRNPYRIGFDRDTGALYIGDVGQDAYEEVDLGIAGANYGWPITEGDHCYSGGSCDRTGLTDPIYEYAHNSNVYAVIGGTVYRGCALPDLVGLYFFADAPWFGSGPMWTLDLSGATATAGPVWTSNAGALIVSFGEDEEGELYVADAANSRVAKIVAGNR